MLTLPYFGRVLVGMLKDGDVKVRRGVANAFATAAIDPNFRNAVLRVRMMMMMMMMVERSSRGCF
jgi:hypothetical protein